MVHGKEQFGKWFESGYSVGAIPYWEKHPKWAHGELLKIYG